MTIQQRVIKYINLQHEGDSWDFKREWHHDTADLLHDVICMSNLLVADEGLIIIGVDEESSYSVCDVTADPNRRDTMEMANFLRDKPFASGVRPMVHVVAIDLDGKIIDVIVVEKSLHVPFYLAQDFKGQENNHPSGRIVKANYIYTRVGDSNTPIDKSADPDKVEALWRKRFGLDLTPADKFGLFLQDYDNWESLDGCESWFYKPSPEYQIVSSCDESATADEYYCLVGVNCKPSWYKFRLLYHQTAIAKIRCVTIEGGIVFLVAPDFEIPSKDPFYFYVSGSLRKLLNEFLYMRYSDPTYRFEYGRLNMLVPTFASEGEKQDFFNWLKDQNLPAEPSNAVNWIDIDYPGVKQALILNEMLEQFRVR